MTMVFLWTKTFIKHAQLAEKQSKRGKYILLKSLPNKEIIDSELRNKYVAPLSSLSLVSPGALHKSFQMKFSINSRWDA